MTVQQTNKIIAEYMGLTEDEYPSNLPPETEVCGNFMDNEIHYHDRIDWLYPVARRVKEELITWAERLKEAGQPLYTDKGVMECIQNLSWAGSSFEMIPIYNAVVEAIEFLNQQKEG